MLTYECAEIIDENNELLLMSKITLPLPNRRRKETQLKGAMNDDVVYFLRGFTWLRRRTLLNCAKLFSVCNFVMMLRKITWLFDGEICYSSLVVPVL